jgi:WD40 repeat protein
MRVLARFMIGLFVAVSLVASAFAQTPAAVTAAVEALGAALGRPLALDDLTNWRYRIELWQESNLGCPALGAGTPLNAPVNVYIVTLDYQGASYEYRTTEARDIAFFCGANFTVTPTPPTPIGALSQSTAIPGGIVTPEPCPTAFAGYLPPRLQIGAGARVEVGGVPNRLRDAPNVNALQIGMINPGGTATVVGGPSCDSVSQIVWWRVNYNNVIGWTAEGVLPDDYFVAPIGVVATSTPFVAPRAPVVPLPEERSVITPAAVVNASSVRELGRIPLTSYPKFAFAPDSSIVVVATLNEAITAYQLPALTLDPLSFADVPTDVLALTFAPDGQAIAFGTLGGEIWRFDLQTETARRVAVLPNGTPIYDIAVSADGSIAVSAGQTYGGGETPLVSVYDPTTGAVRFTRAVDGLFGTGIAFDARGDALLVADSSLNTLDAADGSPFFDPMVINDPRLSAIAVAARADGTQRTAFTTGSGVGVFNRGLSDFIRLTLPGADQRGLSALAVAFSPSGDLIAASSGVIEGADQGGEVTLFDPTVDFARASIPLVSGDIAFSPDGTLLAIATGTGLVFYGV